jgi:hypothetical protein
MKFELEPATDKQHKYLGVFTDDKGEQIRIPFGAKGYEDLTMHRNRIRAKLYLARHRPRENWNDPMTPGALSRWILWETPHLETNVRRFKQKFNLS